jgi:hypothetical protein
MVCPVCVAKLTGETQHVIIKEKPRLKISMYNCHECKAVFDVITRLKEKGE